MTTSYLKVAASALGLVLLAGCGSSTGPATSRNNPGTGSSTLKAVADIDANDDPAVIGGFSTDYRVSVRDGANTPVSGATVTISNPGLPGGKVTLPETGRPRGCICSPAIRFRAVTSGWTSFRERRA